MIRFELKKILNSRINLIAMLMGYVLLAVVFCSQNFGSDSIYCQDTDTYLLAVVIICISPVFSKECDTGAVTLLLTTKYGKTQLIKAKVVASMIFSCGYLLICFRF